MAAWDLTWVIVFLASAGVLGWTYVGYAIWLRRAAASCKNPAPAPAGPPSSCTISTVIAARNEASRIHDKVAQLLSLNCARMTEIIVVCDHCTDDTAEIARAAHPSVVVVELKEGPGGKGAAINAGVATASGDLILFNDVRQSLAPDAAERLAAWFSDPATGAVSGSLEIQSSVEGSGKGLDAYWSLEKRIRHDESVLDSSIGCTGAIYMIRRSLFKPIPHDTILDDVVIPMMIASQGARVRFDPDASAFDPQPLAGVKEASRKRRTLAGNFQMLFRYPVWLLPWRSRLWFKLLSHKYLRILSPVFLALCFLATLCLAHHPLFLLGLVLQLICALLAVLGLAVPGLRGRIFALPSAFMLLQLSVVRGFVYWLSMTFRGQQGWK